MAEAQGDHRQAPGGAVDAGEQQRLVVLQIAVVAAAEALHQAQQARQLAVAQRRLTTHQLEQIGVALVRHHRRPACDRAAQPHEPVGAQLDDVGGEAGEVQADARAREREQQRVITGAHRVDGVARPMGEAEHRRGVGGVDRQRRTGDRAGAERRLGQLVGDHQQQAAITTQRLDQRAADPCAGQHRDGDLAVGVGGHGDLTVALAEHVRRREHALQPALDGRDRLPGPQLEIGRDLIVATAAGVQLVGHVPEGAAEVGLDRHVHVLLVVGQHHRAGGDLRGQRGERGDQRVGLLRGQQPGDPEPLDVGDAASAVLLEQASIDRERARPRQEFRIEVAPGRSGSGDARH